MATTPTVEGLMAMRHRDVLDVHGEKVGELVEVYFDKATRVPEWVGIDTSLFGMKRVLAPAMGARIDDRGVYIAWGKDAVLDTPEVLDQEISQDVERNLYEHYGLQYSFEGSPTGLPRDVATREPAAYEERDTGAPAAGTYPAHEMSAWQWPDVPKDDRMRLEESALPSATPGAPYEAVRRGHLHRMDDGRDAKSRVANLGDSNERVWLLGALAAAGASILVSLRHWRWPAIVLRGVALALLYTGVTQKSRHVEEEAQRHAAAPPEPKRSLKDRVLTVVGRS